MDQLKGDSLIVGVTIVFRIIVGNYPPANCWFTLTCNELMINILVLSPNYPLNIDDDPHELVHDLLHEYHRLSSLKYDTPIVS